MAMAENIQPTGDIPTWTIGDRLRKARQVHKWSQQRMADELGARGIECERSTVGSWELEVNQPHKFQRVVAAWADATNISFLWLWSGRGDSLSSNLNPPELTLINGTSTPRQLELRGLDRTVPTSAERRGARSVALVHDVA